VKRLILTILVFGVAGCRQQQIPKDNCLKCHGEIKISRAALQDKIKGGWLGKTAGVCIGAPTEFKAKGKMFTGPLNLYPNLSGGFSQDDIYVQITFIDAMDKKLDEPDSSRRRQNQSLAGSGRAEPEPDGIFAATMADYGEAFRNSSYQLWHANKAGRDNLRKGISPPQSGMWAGPGNRFNIHANDIDWQIECDWIGLMCPAMPMTAMAISNRAGHVTNYGDGLYGGHFISTMIALAFECNDVEKIISQAIESVPRKSQYYKVIKDVIDFHDKNPDDFNGCWKFINDKYLNTIVDCNTEPNNFKIAASFNGAFITIGLLYGDGDILKTIEYATRCGQDSDCNPANAGAILGTMLGYDKLPQQWKDSIEKYPNNKYSHTNYTFADLINSSFRRAEKTILQSGGRLEGNTYIIKAQPVCQPKILEQFGQDPVPNPDFQ
jgi:hypothetical protein